MTSTLIIKSFINSTMKVTLTVAENEYETRIGLLKLSGTNGKIVNTLRRLSETQTRRILSITDIKDMSKGGRRLCQIHDVIRDNISVLRIGFPANKKEKTDIVAKLAVVNETNKRRMLTTKDIQFIFDGKPVDWKPKREDQFLELRPNEGVSLRMKTVSGQCSNNGLFRIAIVDPCQTDINEHWIFYKIQDTVKVRDFILDTIQIIRKTFTEIKSMLNDKKEEMQRAKQYEFDMSMFDMSIAYLMHHVGMHLGTPHRDTVEFMTTQVNPETPCTVILKIRTKEKSDVYTAMTNIVDDSMSQFDILMKEVERVKVQSGDFVKMFHKRKELVQRSIVHHQRTFASR